MSAHSFRRTTIIQKLLPSVINAALVFFVSLPLLEILPIYQWKLAVIGIFFIYNLFFLIFNRNRCLGMIMCGTYWNGKVHFKNEILFIFLYTLSFSTLLFSVYIPFDIFLVNMFLLQLPTIQLTGTTLHSYLSGNKSSIIYRT